MGDRQEDSEGLTDVEIFRFQQPHVSRALIGQARDS